MRIKGKILINVEDIIGKCLGELCVEKYMYFRYEPTVGAGGRRVRHYYMCKCRCGNEKMYVREILLKGEVKSCGCKSRKGRNKKWQ